MTKVDGRLDSATQTWSPCSSAVTIRIIGSRKRLSYLYISQVPQLRY